MAPATADEARGAIAAKMQAKRIAIPEIVVTQAGELLHQQDLRWFTFVELVARPTAGSVAAEPALCRRLIQSACP